jgi:hypothetical protein
VVNIISDKMNPTTTITGTKHPRKPREMTKWFKQWSEIIFEPRMSNVENTLKEHSKILNDHSEILKKHSEILERHSEIFERNNLR